jgi:hypothetical protein
MSFLAELHQGRKYIARGKRHVKQTENLERHLNGETSCHTHQALKGSQSTRESGCVLTPKGLQSLCA